MATITFNSDEEVEDVATVVLTEDGQAFIFSLSEYDHNNGYGVFGIGWGIKRLSEENNSLISILTLLLGFFPLAIDHLQSLLRLFSRCSEA